MNIFISNSSGLPIYEQICGQIKNIIISGEFQEGDALPSIRLLAKELRISVITTKRAYEELEKEGFIVSVPGKGSYVSGPNLELIKEENLKQIESHLLSVIQLAETCQLSREEIIEMLNLLFEGETK